MPLHRQHSTVFPPVFQIPECMQAQHLRLFRFQHHTQFMHHFLHKHESSWRRPRVPLGPRARAISPAQMPAVTVPIAHL